MTTTQTTWNIADIWEGVAGLRPEATALVHGDERTTWGDLDRRADGVARFLLDHGLNRQDKVALYLVNHPAYLETVFACFKASLVPVNTNYRYSDDELRYLWADADVTAVVFHGQFTPHVEQVRAQFPAIHTWLWVDDGSGPCPPWAVPYEHAARSADARTIPPWGRSGADLLFIYTGGTTGRPKGVMWEQDTLVRYAIATSDLPFGEDPTPEDFLTIITAHRKGAVLAACPLMHGTGMLVSFGELLEGGTVVTLPGTRFDAAAVLDTIQRERAQGLAIVGDAFARPLLRALDDEPDRWDLSSLQGIVSSGVMWSEPVKDALLRHLPGAVLVDFLSSSEGLGMGVSISAAGATSATATFAASPIGIVLDEEGRPVQAGSGAIGRLGVRGFTPVGYYKDPDRSATTFPVIDGVRYSLPGDWATVEADGTITLLGRGSMCINTGGEKVFPEEVEEALKLHPSVHDAVAVGVPDDELGHVVVAVVEPAEGADVDEGDLIAHVKQRLASYKAPRHVVTIAGIDRAPNAKVDYHRLRTFAEEKLGATAKQ